MKPRALLFLGGTLALAASVPAAVFSPSAHATSLAAPSPARTGALVAHTKLLVRGAASHSASSAYQDGERLLRAGQYAAAERAFQRAISHHDHTAAAYAGLATAAVGKRDFVTAFKSFRHATALEPRNPVYQYGAAYSALYAGDYHSAVSYASTYIKLKPRDPKGYHLRFLAYGNLLERKQQVQDATALVHLQPHDPSALNDLGIALANDRQYRLASQILTRAIHLQPKNGLFWGNRALAEYELKEYTASLHDFQHARALTKDPLRRKQLDAAIAQLRKKTHH